MIAVPRREMLWFAAVGASGTVVNTLLLWLLHSVLGVHYLLAAAIATECAIVHNFVANDRLTFAHRRTHASVTARFARFQVVSLGTATGTVGLLWLLTRAGGERLLLLSNVAAIGIMFVANFVLNRYLTWSRVGALPERA